MMPSPCKLQVSTLCLGVHGNSSEFFKIATLYSLMVEKFWSIQDEHHHFTCGIPLPVLLSLPCCPSSSSTPPLPVRSHSHSSQHRALSHH